MDEGAGRYFILASFFYLGIGPLMGFMMAYLRGKWVLRLMPAHAHVNLLGWVSMMIFGFSYTFLPMLAGKELYSDMLPYVHLVLVNAGLVGMAVIWIGSRFPNSPISPVLVWPFGAMVVLSIWIYLFNMIMTFMA